MASLSNDLIEASKMGNLEAVISFLEDGEDLNSKDENVLSTKTKILLFTGHQQMDILMLLSSSLARRLI